MSKGTRSTVNLPGPLTDYILENTTTMGEEDVNNPESLQNLLAMMTKTLAAVTQHQQPPAQTSQHSKIESCPIKRPSSSLDAWIDEVLLWDESNAVDVNCPLPAQRYSLTQTQL